MTGAVGMITETAHANEIITGGDADLVFLARELFASRTGPDAPSTSWALTRPGRSSTDTPCAGGRHNTPVRQIGHMWSGNIAGSKLRCHRRSNRSNTHVDVEALG